jgi:hypothetical protein
VRSNKTLNGNCRRVGVTADVGATSVEQPAATDSDRCCRSWLGTLQIPKENTVAELKGFSLWLSLSPNRQVRPKLSNASGQSRVEAG